MSVKEFDWLFVQMDMFLPQSTEGKGPLQYNISENIYFSVWHYINVTLFASQLWQKANWKTQVRYEYLRYPKYSLD